MFFFLKLSNPVGPSVAKRKTHFKKNGKLKTFEIQQCLEHLRSVLQGSDSVAAPDPGPLLPELARQGPLGAGAAPCQTDLSRSDQPTGGAVEEQPGSITGGSGEAWG